LRFTLRALRGICSGRPGYHLRLLTALLSGQRIDGTQGGQLG
jgi:hypothetical protein